MGYRRICKTEYLFGGVGLEASTGDGQGRRHLRPVYSALVGLGLLDLPGPGLSHRAEQGRTDGKRAGHVGPQPKCPSVSFLISCLLAGAPNLAVAGCLPLTFFIIHLSSALLTLALAQECPESDPCIARVSVPRVVTDVLFSSCHMTALKGARDSSLGAQELPGQALGG